MNAQASTRALHQKLAIGVLVALSAAVSVTGLVAYQRNEEAELRSLPLAERASLFQRTFETLNFTCTHTNGKILAGYCRKQAEFLVRFPECNDSCQRTCHRFFPRPTK
jgi:hypothetical protein